MNQKILVAIIIILVLIIGIMAGLYISKTGTVQTQPNILPIIQPATDQPISTPPITTEPIQPAATPVTPAPNNPLTYTNTDFGFQITLPKGWENFKVDINNKEAITNGTVYIHFLVPTTDKAYPYAILSNGSKLNGYVDVIAITAWNKSEWDKQKNSQECKTNPNPGCPFEGSKLGESAKYVFDITHGNGTFPDDIMGVVDNLFKKTGAQTTGQSVAQKLDFQLLP
ncbi:MAG: hypothetical protein NTZ97_02030 [Candidatus Moranbacteria bacterium]|nr:hypothetical protein [Candidatus Moranbacteria bacterium]